MAVARTSGRLQSTGFLAFPLKEGESFDSVDRAGWIYDKEARRQRRAGWPVGSSVRCRLVRKLVRTAVTRSMLAVEDTSEPSWVQRGARPTKQVLEPCSGDWALAAAAELGSRGGAAPARPSERPPSCSGAHCFRLTFLILAGVCVLGSVLSGWLARRTQSFYRERRQERLRREETRRRLSSNA